MDKRDQDLIRKIHKTQEDALDDLFEELAETESAILKLKSRKEEIIEEIVINKFFDNCVTQWQNDLLNEIKKQKE